MSTFESQQLPEWIGMIAGNGTYPFTWVKAARKAGIQKILAVAFHDETESSLADCVDEIVWLRVGQLGKLIKTFKTRQISHAVMVGQIAPKNLFDLRPDLRALWLLARLKERNAESLFKGIADEMEKDGTRLMSATTFLEDHLPKPGHVAGPPLGKRRDEDIAFGLKIAKEVSRLDIGQTVVVRRGTVLAVEGFEGTNECLLRGGALGRGKQVTVVKVSKPNQDYRFDVPVVGPITIEVAAKAGIDLIVVEANSTLLLQPEQVEELCQKHRITLWAADTTAPLLNS